MLFSSNFKNRNMVVCEVKDGEVLDIYDLLKDPSVVNRNPNLYLTSDELDLPYLISVDSKAFTEMFDLIDDEVAPTEDVLSQIKSALDSVVPLTIEEYRGMYKAIRALHSYFEETKVEINFPPSNYENFKETSELVNKVKRKSSSFSASRNKTLFRNTPNDELFIMVPSPDSLVLAEGITSFIPSMKNVFKPFEDEELYNYNYKRSLKKNGLGEEVVIGDPNNNKFELYPEEERYYEALKSLHNALMEREHPNNSLEDCIKYNEYSELFKMYMGYMIVEALRYHRNQSGFISLNSYSNDEEGDNDDLDGNSGDELSLNLFYNSNRKGNFDGEEVILSMVEDQIKKDCYAPINILIQALRFGEKLPSKLELFGNRFFDLREFSYSNLSGSFASYVVKKTSLGNNYKVIKLVNANNRIADSEYIRVVDFKKPKLECPIGLVLKKDFEDSNESQLVLISFVDLVRFSSLDDSLTIDGVSVVNGKVLIDSSIVTDSLIDEAMSLDDVVGRLNYPSFISYVNPVMKGDFIECNSYNNSISSLSILKDFLGSNNLKNLNVFVSVSKDDVFDKVKTYMLSAEYILRCTVGYYMLDLTIQADKFITSISMEKFGYNLQDVISVYESIVNSSDYPLGVYTSEYGDYVSQKKGDNSSGNASGNVVSNASGNASVNVARSSIFSDNGASVASGDSDNSGNSINKVKENPNNAPSQAKSNAGESVIGNNMYDLDNLFYKGEIDNIVKVVMPTELVSKVNNIYKELNNPFQIKSLVVEGDMTIVGYLTVVNKKYVLLEPKEYPIVASKKFTLTKLGPIIMSIIRAVASGNSPSFKFDSLETLNYYCRIIEKC